MIIPLRSIISSSETKLGTGKLKEVLPYHLTDKISNIPIPMNEIQVRVVLKFTLSGKFLVKTAKWVDDDSIPPRPRGEITKLHLETEIDS